MAVLHLAEALVGPPPRLVGAGLLEDLRVELLGAAEIVEPERDLRLQQPASRLRGAVLGPGGEPVLGHAEAVAELPEQLKRGDPVAGLDAGDVRGRAPGEGELALAQSGPLAGGAEAPAHRRWVIDVR